MMENDQIKSQIENAKQAFVASKERDREVDARNWTLMKHKTTNRQHNKINSSMKTLCPECVG